MLNEFNGLKVELYESIDDLPIDRYNKFQRYALIDAEVGASIGDVVSHLNKVANLIKANSNETALKALNNISESIAMIFSEQQPVNSAYVCLIKSINGKPMTDISEVSINNTIALLNSKRAKHSAISMAVNTVKKNLKQSLSYFFRRWQKT